MRTLLICIGLLASQLSFSQDLLPIIEIQGETDLSPYEGQEVSFNALVTDYFGDFWFMQDGFGEWNGIMVHDSTLLVPENPPWWNEPRQPETGDELTITGTVVELNGNTQIVDAVLVEQTEFWMATALGTLTGALGTQNEALEGTRVRLMSMTVVTAADGNDEWTITDGFDEVICIGIDDEADPFPGDVYDVYGPIVEVNGVYKVQIADIDVISLSTEDIEVAVTMSPNPMTESMQITLPVVADSYQLFDASGRIVGTDFPKMSTFEILRSNLPAGSYVLRISAGGELINRTITVR
jgi:hypothetical protein